MAPARGKESPDLPRAPSKGRSCRTVESSPSSVLDMSGCRSLSPSAATGTRGDRLRHRSYTHFRAQGRLRPHARGRAAGSCSVLISASRPIRPSSRRGLLHRDGSDPDRSGATTGPERIAARLEDGRRSLEERRHRRLRVHRLSRRDGGRLRADPGAGLGPRRRDAISRSAIRPSGSIPATRLIGSRQSRRSWPARMRAPSTSSRRSTVRW